MRLTGLVWHEIFKCLSNYQQVPGRGSQSQDIILSHLQTCIKSPALQLVAIVGASSYRVVL